MKKDFKVDFGVSGSGAWLIVTSMLKSRLEVARLSFRVPGLMLGEYFGDAASLVRKRIADRTYSWVSRYGGIPPVILFEGLITLPLAVRSERPKINASTVPSPAL